MDQRLATDEGWNGSGSAGLTLLLFASIVCAATVGLYGAHSDDVSEVAAAEPIVAPQPSPILPASFTAIEDELLASPMFENQEFLYEVGRWVRFWETTHSKWLPTYLERMTWFEDNVDAVLAVHELPWSLRFLPILESGYSPSAVSSASAVGLWQFMEPTARDFDMEVTRLVDERRDPFKSTEAAASFLGQLRTDFDSWFLALAAYNAGPDRIRGILRRHAPGAVLSAHARRSRLSVISFSRLGEPISSSPSINILTRQGSFLAVFTQASTAMRWHSTWPLSSALPRAKMAPSRMTGSNGSESHNDRSPVG